DGLLTLRRVGVLFVPVLVVVGGRLGAHEAAAFVVLLAVVSALDRSRQLATALHTDALDGVAVRAARPSDDDATCHVRVLLLPRHHQDTHSRSGALGASVSPRMYWTSTTAPLTRSSQCSSMYWWAT